MTEKSDMRDNNRIVIPAGFAIAGGMLVPIKKK